MDLHGGNIYRIFRENKIEKVLDYSSNINPFGVPESLKKGMMESMEVLEKYPDPEYYELRKKFAEYNDVKIENVLVGNGATELIFLYMKVIKPKKVLILSPTFAEYERGIKSAVPECSIEYFDLDMEKDFVLNVEILKKELAKKYDLVVMCNPNNPTGKFISASEAEDLLSECDKYGTKLFIDEAFIEFVSGGIKSSLIFGKADKKNLFIIRALTKFFAIPGLRLGYALYFDQDLKEKIDKIKEPWSVNAFAELAGKTLFEDKNYIEKTEKWIEEEKKYMYHELNKIKDLKVYKTDTNFILLKSLGSNAKILREKMLEKGILIRDASNFKYLDERFIRLAIKDRENNDFVIKKLKEVLDIGERDGK